MLLSVFLNQEKFLIRRCKTLDGNNSIYVTFALEINMKQSYKISLAIFLTMIMTFLATVYFVNKRSAQTIADLVIKTSIEMQSFNDVGRVETFDTLENLVRKGCNKEALEFIKVQQTFLLSELKDNMEYSEKIKNDVMERSAKIGERAIKYVSQQGVYVQPSCK